MALPCVTPPKSLKVSTGVATIVTNVQTGFKITTSGRYTIEVWGAGGGGGAGITNGGGGGAGGSYTKLDGVFLNAGDILQYTLGTGGLGGTLTGATGGDGGATTLLYPPSGLEIVVPGGLAGSGDTLASGAGGAAPKIGVGGTINLPGNAGSNRVTTTGGAGGGGAGPGGGAGGAGSVAADATNGGTGAQPGGGGGGGASGASNAGGPGGDGQIKLTWVTRMDLI